MIFHFKKRDHGSKKLGNAKNGYGHKWMAAATKRQCCSQDAMYFSMLKSTWFASSYWITENHIPLKSRETSQDLQRWMLQSPPFSLKGKREGGSPMLLLWKCWWLLIFRAVLRRLNLTCPARRHWPEPSSHLCWRSHQEHRLSVPTSGICCPCTDWQQDCSACDSSQCEWHCWDESRNGSENCLPFSSYLSPVPD